MAIDAFEQVDGPARAERDVAPLHPVDPDEVEAALASMVARHPGRYRATQQVAMALAVARGITEGRPTLTEAPTGVGKCMAYLVPAALASGSEPIVVATATKTLQQQLVDSDLPALAEQFPGL